MKYNLKHRKLNEVNGGEKIEMIFEETKQKF